MNEQFLNVLAFSVQGTERNNRIIAFSIANNLTIYEISETFYTGLYNKFPNRWQQTDNSVAIEIADEIYNMIENLNLDLKTCFEPILPNE